jgi:hypothetical protein
MQNLSRKKRACLKERKRPKYTRAASKNDMQVIPSTPNNGNITYWKPTRRTNSSWQAEG